MIQIAQEVYESGNIVKLLYDFHVLAGIYMDTLRGTINERAKSAVKEMEEKQREIR